MGQHASNEFLESRDYPFESPLFKLFQFEAAEWPFHPRRTRVCFGQSSYILLVLWFLGLVTSYAFGGFIHILLVLAVIVLVIQLIQGRRVV